jgi:peptide/nickel transport system substrate-binding protein
VKADLARRAALALALLAAPGAAAQTVLRIGVAVETRALDPHLHAGTNSAQALRHIFETLVALDEAQRPVPGLALSWAMDPADPRRWVLRLREGVRFQGGQPFGAADVAASLRRAVDLPGGVGAYASYLRQVVAVTELDPLTVEIRTAAPHAALPHDLSAPMMVSRRAASLPTEAFNAGGAAIGTGPYRVVAWRRGAALELARDPGHRDPPAWDRVELLLRPADPSRVAALLAGEVDVIEHVPTSALDSLARRDDVALAQARTSRLIYLGLDTQRAVTPHFTDAAGVPLAPNPLRDPRVRLALSLAINRAALVGQVMGGAGVPAGQFMPDGHPGTSPALRPDPHDPAEARRLLRAAGVPEGARLVLQGPNDRYLNDEKLLVALAGMLQRVGLAAEPLAAPMSVFRARTQRGEASLALGGWATETGDASLALRALLGARGRPTGWGQANWLGHENAAFEAALAAAMAEVSEPARLAALARATEIAAEDRGVLPLFFQNAVWATRRGFAYRPRADEYTLAWSVMPAAAARARP